MTDNPSGATMVGRTEIVKVRVAHILKMFPQTKGDDRQLVYRYCRLYTGVRITFSEFQKLRACPAFGTIERRRRQLQEKEKKLIAAGELRLEDAEYLPREGTIKKRETYREATKHYYGKGLTLADFEAIG